jgi:hypothetical protein
VNPEDMTAIEFRASSFCSAGTCVEVGRLPNGRVAVRDGKGSGGEPLVFTAQEWSAFVAGVKRGEFD